jgi:hypothetical protein
LPANSPRLRRPLAGNRLIALKPLDHQFDDLRLILDPFFGGQIFGDALYRNITLAMEGSKE